MFSFILCARLNSGSKAEEIQDFLRQRIDDGKALLILDGLDEIDDALKRANFCEQIETIALQNERLAIIATSRIVGYREMGRRLGRGFEHMILAELLPEEKDEFVRRWCELTEHPDKREGATNELIADIHSTDRIERLTANPMLLTAMALVKRKVGKLPPRRASLYSEAFELLLNWNPKEGGPIDDWEALPQLEYLAYAMCDRGVQQLPEQEIVGLFEQMRRDFPSLRDVTKRTSAEFLKALEARTAILNQAGYMWSSGASVAAYEFRHLTFQEIWPLVR